MPGRIEVLDLESTPGRSRAAMAWVDVHRPPAIREGRSFKYDVNLMRRARVRTRRGVRGANQG